MKMDTDNYLKELRKKFPTPPMKLKTFLNRIKMVKKEINLYNRCSVADMADDAIQTANKLLAGVITDLTEFQKQQEEDFAWAGRRA